jgi:acyl carrier protein
MMTREEIKTAILDFFRKEFEIENPGMEDNLREIHDFDSIDAIELLLEIETLLGSELTQEEKKQAMDIQNLNDICDYVAAMVQVRQLDHGQMRAGIP